MILTQAVTRSLMVSGGIIVSNGNYVDEPFDAQGGWVDDSAGNSSIAFVPDGSNDVLKLIGGSYAATNISRAVQVLSGPAGDRITLTVRVRGNWSDIADFGGQYSLQVHISATEMFRMDLYGDSVRIVDTVAGNTNIPTTTPTSNLEYFTVDISRSLGNCTLRQGNVILGSSIDCIVAISKTQWTVQHVQLSRVLPYIERIGCVDLFLVGDDLIIQ